MLCCYLNDYLWRCVCPRHFCQRGLVWGARAYHSTGVKSALTPDKFPPHRPLSMDLHTVLLFFLSLFIYSFFISIFICCCLTCRTPKNKTQCRSNAVFIFFLLTTLGYSLFQQIACAVFSISHSMDGFKHFTYSFSLLAVPFYIFKGHSRKVLSVKVISVQR